MGNKFSSFFRRKKANTVGITEPEPPKRTISTTTITKSTCDSPIPSFSCPDSLQTYALPPTPTPKQEELEQAEIKNKSHATVKDAENESPPKVEEPPAAEPKSNSPSLLQSMVGAEEVLKSELSESVQVFDLEDYDDDTDSKNNLLIEDTATIPIFSTEVSMEESKALSKKLETSKRPGASEEQAPNTWDIDDLSTDGTGGYVAPVPKMVTTGDGRNVMMADITPDTLKTPPKGIVTEESYLGDEYDADDDEGEGEEIQLEVVGKPLPRALSGVQKERIHSAAILKSLQDANLISSTTCTSNGGTAWNLLESPNAKATPSPLEPLSHLAPLNFPDLETNPLYKKLPGLVSKPALGKIEVSTENEHTRIQERHALKMKAAEERRKRQEEQLRARLQSRDRKRKLTPQKGELLLKERQMKNQEDLISKIKAAEQRRAEKEQVERERLQKEALKLEKAKERRRLNSELSAESNQPIDMSATFTVSDSADSSSLPVGEKAKADEDLPHTKHVHFQEPATVMGSLLAEQKAVDDLVSRYMRSVPEDEAKPASPVSMDGDKLCEALSPSSLKPVGDSNSLYGEEPIETAALETSTDQPIAI